jgi:hypothetical protein
VVLDNHASSKSAGQLIADPACYRIRNAASGEAAQDVKPLDLRLCGRHTRRIEDEQRAEAPDRTDESAARMLSVRFHGVCSFDCNEARMEIISPCREPPKKTRNV